MTPVRFIPHPREFIRCPGTLLKKRHVQAPIGYAALRMA